MPRIIFSLLIIPFLTILNSCEDSLRILPPDGMVKDEYWKKKEDVKATLMGAYQGFAEMDEHLFYYGELRADMLADDVLLSSSLKNIMEGNIFPSNEWADWKSFYAVINYCNLVIKYSPQVKESDPTFTDFNYEAYIAEAVFLRSLAYFYLLRIFKDVPFVLTPSDTDDQDLFPGITEESVILDSLESQLESILQPIPASYETNSLTRGRATRGAVNALLADIALWKFDYDGCIEYVERIEENELYDLVPGRDWFNIFSEGNTLEGIFEIQFNSELGQDNNLYNVTRPQNYNFIGSPFALSLLSRENSKEVVRGNGTLNNDSEKIIWKYIGSHSDGITLRSTSNNRSCNWIVYRLADVLLMKAEALSQTGRYNEALAIVNKIRDRAFVPLIASPEQNSQVFEDLILEERVKELAFEGKRWFDLLRMGRRNNYERKGKLIEIIIQDASATQKRVLAAKLNDPYGWYFPIYTREIENNPNIVQNPYYKVYE